MGVGQLGSSVKLMDTLTQNNAHGGKESPPQPPAFKSKPANSDKPSKNSVSLSTSQGKNQRHQRKRKEIDPPRRTRSTLIRYFAQKRH